MPEGMESFTRFTDSPLIAASATFEVYSGE
jgi:hypothetical protein